MMAIGFANAANSVTLEYTPYRPGPSERYIDASMQVALAAVAWAILSSEPTVDLNLVKKVYDSALLAVPPGDPRTHGAMIGRGVAYELLLARRRDPDGHAGYPTGIGPGRFQIPEGENAKASISNSDVPPFGIANAFAVDPGAPPDFSSDIAQKDTEEAMAVGGARARSRSADQTAAAIFWSSHGDDFHSFIAKRAEEQGYSLSMVARAVAIYSIANFDGGVAMSAAKEKYLRWRPQTAARYMSATTDGGGPWTSLLRTPPNPEYPSGAAISAGIVEYLLPRLGLEATKITIRDPRTGQTRSWDSAAALADELAQSRIWGGIHFRTSVDRGREMGRKIAAAVIETVLIRNPGLPD